MSEKRRGANLIGFIPIGCGLAAVGIGTRNWAFIGAGLVFIIIGVAHIVRKHKSGEDAKEK